MSKRIGILIDGTLRNLGSKVALTYNRRYMTEFTGIIDQFSPFANLPIADDEFLDFICDSALEIYGKAEFTYPNAIRDLNQLVLILENEGYEVVLISRDYYKVRPATLFFLSEAGCEASNIKFIKTPPSVWDVCDTLITGNITMLDTKPEGKDILVLISEENMNMDLNGCTGISTLIQAITYFKPDAFDAHIPEGTVDVEEVYPSDKFNEILDNIESDEV
jgi:hypothetical protein